MPPMLPSSSWYPHFLEFLYIYYIPGHIHMHACVHAQFVYVYVQRYINRICWNKAKMKASNQTKKSDFSLSQWLSITNRFSVQARVWRLSTLGICWLTLILFRSCKGHHRYCDFMIATVLPCPGISISYSSPFTGSYIRSTSFSSMFYEPWRWWC